jgi:hypothetical protein
MGLEKNVVSDIQNMMIKNKYILAFLGILMLSGIAATCQISDNQLWTRATLKFRVNKNLRFDVEEQARFNNDISRLKITLTEGSIVYDLTKKITVKGNFRYICDPYSHNSYRYSGDFSYDFSKKGFPLDFKYRLRLQRDIEEHTRESGSYFRNKFSVDYNLSKLVDPSIAFESYFKLSYVNRFSTNRYIAGLEWRLFKNVDLETFFMYEDEFGEKNPKTNKVFGVGLSYDLKL